MSMTYRNFTITISPRRGFAGLTWYVYCITGNGLRQPIETDMGEQTEALAVNEAKEFIDEHLSTESVSA